MALRAGQSRLAAMLLSASQTLSVHVAAPTCIAANQFASSQVVSSSAAAPSVAAAISLAGFRLQVRGYAQPALASDEEDDQAAPREYPRRTGAIAVKVGMTQEWDQWGVRVPLTVLWFDECQVTQVKVAEKEGYNGLQLGCGSKKEKQVIGTQIGHFRAAGVPIKRHLVEFRVSKDALLPVGTEITAAHFVPGQYVDVTGTTIGKGFQGVMKRFGFAGAPATHGTSKAHRLRGSTGGCQDPGKVWPGTPMAGRMGGKRRTLQSAWVYKVDPERNLLYVKGQVPGHKGNFVYVRDAVFKTSDKQPELPWPTAAADWVVGGAVSPDRADPFGA